MGQSVPEPGRYHAPIRTVDPRIRAHGGARGELQFGNGRLDALVLERVLLDHQDLVVIPVAVHVGAQPDIALDLARREVDHGFMETILSSTVSGSVPHINHGARGLPLTVLRR